MGAKSRAILGSGSIAGTRELYARLEAIGDTRGLMRQLQLDAVGFAKAKAPRKTGNLGRNIRPGSFSGSEAVIEARTPYAAYVEYGTGIYGPRGRPIVPKKAKVLAWRTGAVRLTGKSKVRGGKQLADWAFAKSVRGRPATPFLMPGAQEAVDRSGVDIIVKAWNGAA